MLPPWYLPWGGGEGGAHGLPRTQDVVPVPVGNKTIGTELYTEFMYAAVQSPYHPAKPPTKLPYERTLYVPVG